MENNPTKTEQLEQIVARHQDRLFRFAYFRTGSRPEAEDIVQEVLLKLFRSGTVLDAVENVESYLLRAIANRCCDYHRRKRPTVPLEKAGRITAPDDEPLERERERIDALLENLPPEQAEVIRMKSSDGLTFARIAAVTGTPEATVKSRFRYGLEKLRTFINR